VPPNVKFCGITRSEDALAGVSAGASYLGVVLGPSPRRLTVRQAEAVVTSTRGVPVHWVGVFTEANLSEIAAAVSAIGLDIVQLHTSVTPEFVRDVTRETGARVWSVGRVTEDRVEGLDQLGGVEGIEAVLFDASRAGRSGGLGVTFDWRRARTTIDGWRGRVRIAVAGGLNPTNVGEAVRILDPDIVDVSSGVECAPGVKEQRRMVDFVEAVHSVGLS
jgi:phosphoribosylanthranilate isomerase